MRPHRKPTRKLLTLAVVLLGIVALTFALIGCNDLSGEPDDPGDMPPPGEAEEIPPIDEATIKNLTAAASAFSASQINVIGHDSFGDWAAAYVGVTGQESQLAIFQYVGSGWTLRDIGSYVDPGDLPPGIPGEVSTWAFP